MSKTFDIQKILPLIDYGHLDYGENKVQEAIQKWSNIKQKNPNLKLHLIGKLQSNKVKHALKIFDYIHSLDNKKLADKIAIEQEKQKKKIKIFLQINVGEESQKSGINQDELFHLYKYCKKINLDIIGLMCIPPVDQDPKIFFKKMNTIKKDLKLDDLSMGMSSDYLDAIENDSTYVRIGSSIFGKRN